MCLIKDNFYSNKYDALVTFCTKKMEPVQPLVSQMKQFRMGLLLGLGPAHSIAIHRKTLYLAFFLKSSLPLIPLFSTNLHAQTCAPVS